MAYSPELIESRGDTSMEFGANYAQFYILKLYILIYYIIQITLENYVYINYRLIKAKVESLRD